MEEGSRLGIFLVAFLASPLVVVETGRVAEVVVAHLLQPLKDQQLSTDQVKKLLEVEQGWQPLVVAQPERVVLEQIAAVGQQLTEHLEPVVEFHSEFELLQEELPVRLGLQGEMLN